MDFFADPKAVEADLDMLESLRWSKKEFFDRICRACMKDDEKILDMLRLEATYQFAEFFYLLRARRIETEEDIDRFVEMHNQHIEDLLKDKAKMERLGLTPVRLLDAIFTSDTRPRLLQNWRDRPGAVDQSNLARLLATVMSTETCRRTIVACHDAGFLNRDRTPYGTVLISSNGMLEGIFASSVRDLRTRIQGAQ